MLEPLSTLCVSFLFFSYYIFFIADNISISVYITCFILCLFSALSCRVSALQISMIIIIIIILEKTQIKDGVVLVSLNHLIFGVNTAITVLVLVVPVTRTCLLVVGQFRYIDSDTNDRTSK